MATPLNIAPLGVQHFTDNNGNLASGFKLYTYAAATTSKQAAYTDSTGATALSNPIVLNTRGEPQTASGTSTGIWLTPGQAYKFVLASPTDTDPPQFPVWTVDNIPSPAAAVAAVGGTVQPGMGMDWWGIEALVPAGWLLCVGQTVSRSTYAALFAAIGTTWGAGDGVSTFALPDKRGRVSAAADNMGGVGAGRLTTASLGVAASLGASGGSELLTAHAHTASVTDPGHVHPVNEGWSYDNSNPGAAVNVLAAAGQPTSGPYYQPDTETATTGISVTVASDGGGAAQNVQPVICPNYIIFTGV